MANVRTGDLLNFQDYSPEHNDRTARIEVEAVHASQYGSSTLNSNYNFQEQNPLETDDTTLSKGKYWNYQKYFDVTVEEVMERITSCLIPKKVASEFFMETISNKPDLYGPIWISITLILLIGVSGNIADYIQNSDHVNKWKYDFHLLSCAATAVVFYAWLLPMMLWGSLMWTIRPDANEEMEAMGENARSLMPLLCIYGYSLSIYIPVSLLWATPIFWVQWLLVLFVAFASGYALVHWLDPVLRISKYHYLLVIGVFVFHLLLATGLMLYFFYDYKSVN